MVTRFHLNRRFTGLKCFQTLFLLLTLATFIFCIFEIFHHALMENSNCTRTHNTTRTHDKIDVVYTWVNGSDPRFQHALWSYLNYTTSTRYDSSSQRFNDKDELKYSLRSLERYAPWVNHVYIVTNGQIPHWLDLDYPKVTVVTHDQIFDHPEQLPTFSSPAIEMNLHKIPNLTERFVYFNDDFFLRSPVFPEDFYSVNRGFLIYLERLVPPCSRDCSWLFVADGNCDPGCNNVNCQMDGGDCEPTQSVVTNVTEEMFWQQSLVRSSRNNIGNIVQEYNRKIVERDKLLSMTKNLFRGRTRRLDAYGASVQHTNRVLNDKYGHSIRKLPQHAPIMIDKTIMANLQEKFASEVHTTTHNHLRCSDDLQFSFTYYYFVISERLSPSVDQLFDVVDSDHSGHWSENELRTLATRLYDLPLTDTDLAHLASVVHNCSANFDTSRSVVCNCLPMTRLLEHNAAKIMDVRRYKYEVIANSDYIVFKMLTSNRTLVEQQLDEVRKKSRVKFVCLNDNLNPLIGGENFAVRGILREFYRSLFPDPSRFELGGNYRNLYLHVDEYNRAMERSNYLVVCGFLVSCLMLLLVLLCYCKVKSCKV